MFNSENSGINDILESSVFLKADKLHYLQISAYLLLKIFIAKNEEYFITKEHVSL
jgi:hypothetical protein